MSMRPAHVVEIVTPKRFLLNGLWFGSQRPERCIVWVHGLGSSMFSKLKIADELAGGKVAVLVFNNRGHDKVANLSHASRSFKRSQRAGAAHERFVDCVDDIQGAVNFARRAGVKEIYLAGHSTGCQKSIYWASKRGRRVKGIMLFAPLSDYEVERLEYGERKLRAAEKIARQYAKQGKKHVMLPPEVWDWPWIADAQRFLSLYTGKSAEEIFTYWDESRNPKTLRSIRIPMLVLLAKNEEYTDVPAKQIATWFEKHLQKGKVMVVPRVKHSFRGGEKVVAKAIREFMKETR